MEAECLQWAVFTLEWLQSWMACGKQACREGRASRYLVFISRGPWEVDHHADLRLQVVH